MLVLRRKEGQWIEVTHRSGDTIRIRVCNIRARYPGQLDLALDDPDRNFLIQRPERAAREAEPQAAPEFEINQSTRPTDDGTIPAIAGTVTLPNPTEIVCPSPPAAAC